MVLVSVSVHSIYVTTSYTLFTSVTPSLVNRITFVPLVCFSYSRLITKVVILTHLLLLLEIKHPVLDMYRNNFGAYVAEYIELANRALSETTARTSQRSEVFFLSLRSFFH